MVASSVFCEAQFECEQRKPIISLPWLLLEGNWARLKAHFIPRRTGEVRALRCEKRLQDVCPAGSLKGKDAYDSRAQSGMQVC